MWSRIFCVHIETSSPWAEFVNKNRCISVRLVSEEVKSLNFDSFDISHKSFLCPVYFIDFYCERWIPCQASTSVLYLHYRPVLTIYSPVLTIYSPQCRVRIPGITLEHHEFSNLSGKLKLLIIHNYSKKLKLSQIFQQKSKINYRK